MSMSGFVFPHDCDQEFLALLEAYCNGTISAETQSQLNAKLQADPAAMEAFVLYLDFHSRLQRWASRTGHSQNPITTCDVNDSTSPLIPQSNNSWFSDLRTWTAVLSLGLFFLGLGYWFVREQNQNGKQTDFVAAGKKSPAVGDVTGKGQSSVRSIQFDSGVATISLEKIGTVTVEGPSDFQMITPMRARLTKGKIQVRITEETGHGFQVETPSGLVTDLGTEFLLNVSKEGKTDLAVIQGVVDLQVSHQNQKIDDSPIHRLEQGDGVNVDGAGNIDRLMAITRGKDVTFHTAQDLSEDQANAVPLITSVTDNLSASDTKRFYEIVPGGFGEDVKAFVDRNYEWNGADKNGIPEFLRGGDYIMPFNADKSKELQVKVSVSRAATIYVLFDDRKKIPAWLSQDFENTKLKVGLDEDEQETDSNAALQLKYKRIRPEKRSLARGAGESIDFTFTIWKREIAAAETVTLESVGRHVEPFQGRSMYGIVVVPRDDATSNLKKKTL